VDLSVATWNLQGRDPDDAGMAALVDRHDPDVLLLQEADGPALAACASLAGHRHRVLRADAGYPPGLAILSRFELGDVGALADPAGRRRPRLIWARLRHDGGGVLVASMHAAAPIGDPRFDNPWRRAVQLRAIAEFAAGLAGSSAIIGGDTNTVRLAIEGYRDAADVVAGAERTWRPIGGASWLPPLARLDRIFVSPDVDVISSTTECRISRSDHCPVATRLRPRPSSANIT
jgi:endonuclease/exonuclease/phosphatase family metal-dependent hydrolase